MNPGHPPGPSGSAPFFLTFLTAPPNMGLSRLILSVGRTRALRRRPIAGRRHIVTVQRATVFAILAAAGWNSEAFAESRHFTKLAITEEPAPQGERFIDVVPAMDAEFLRTNAVFFNAIVNQSGNVLFRGLSSDGETFPAHLFFFNARTSALERIVELAAPIDGSGENALAGIEEFRLSAANQVGFSGGYFTDGTGGSLSAVWVTDGRSGSPTQVFVATPLFSSTRAFSFSDSGVFAFENEGALWIGGGQDVQPVLRTGDAAPGLGSAITFSRFQQPAINVRGQTVFGATIAGPGVAPNTDNSTLWLRNEDGGLALIARSNGPVPAADDRFRTVDMVGQIDGLGNVAFGCQTEKLGEGYMVGPVRQLRFIPGSFDGRSSFLKLLANNRVATVLASTQLRIGNAESLTTVLQHGSAIPGSTRLLSGLASIAFSESGERVAAVLFWFDVAANRGAWGLWAGPPRAMQLIVEEDDRVEVAPGDTRLVKGMTLENSVSSFGPNSYRMAINDAGDLAFVLTFDREFGVRNASQGVFLTRVVVPNVPAPSGGASDPSLSPTDQNGAAAACPSASATLTLASLMGLRFAKLRRQWRA